MPEPNYRLFAPAKMSERSRKGQIIVIVLGVMMIALIVGLAVSSRVITSIRQSSYSGQSAKALSLAEAGAEDGLKWLKDTPAPSLPHSGSITLGDGTCNYTIGPLAASAVVTEISPISPNEVIQIELDGYAGGSVLVSWVGRSDSEELANPVALVASLIYDDAGTYKVWRYAWDPGGGYHFYAPDLAVGDYWYDVLIPMQGTPKFLRLRALSDADVSNSIAVSGTGGSLLPSQGIVIFSTGYVGKIRRSVEVFKSEPMLPEIFDFVLWSGSEDRPLPVW